MTRSTQALAEINEVLKKYDMHLSADDSYDSYKMLLHDGYYEFVVEDLTAEARHAMNLDTLRGRLEKRHQTGPWRRREMLRADVCRALVQVYRDRGLTERAEKLSRRIALDRLQRHAFDLTLPTVAAARKQLWRENPGLYVKLFGDAR